MTNTNFVATGRYLVVDLGKENDTVEQYEFGLALQIAQDYAEAEETRTAVLDAETGEVLALVEFDTEEEDIENPMVNEDDDGWRLDPLDDWDIEDDDCPNMCEYEDLFVNAVGEFVDSIFNALGVTGEEE